MICTKTHQSFGKIILRLQRFQRPENLIAFPALESHVILMTFSLFLQVILHFDISETRLFENFDRFFLVFFSFSEKKWSNFCGFDKKSGQAKFVCLLEFFVYHFFSILMGKEKDNILFSITRLCYNPAYCYYILLYNRVLTKFDCQKNSYRRV